MTSRRIVPLSEYHRLPQEAQPSDFYKRLLDVVCNNATVALFIMDERQQCVYMNPAAEVLTGYSLSETKGRALHDVIHHTHPDGRPYPLCECPIDQAFPQNNQEQGEEVFVHRDGHFYPVAYTASPIREGDNITGTIIEVRDISQEKLAEQARQEAERREQALQAETKLTQYRLTHLLEHMSDAFIMLDHEWRIVYQNAEAERLNQKPRSEVLGKTLWEEWPASVGTNVEAQYRRAMAEHVSVHFEHHYYVPPAYDYWLEIHAYPLEDGLGIFYRDIKDRKQAEATIATDLRDTQLLRDLSARLTTETDVQVLYDEILTAAIALTQADAGSFQVLDPIKQELLLLATQNFSPSMVDYFNRVDVSFNTSCGITLATGQRAFVDFDVPASEDPNGYRRLHVDSGVLSAQSTPLISRSGKLIGIVSTHWRTHHRPSDRELRFLDLLARQAADLIEQRKDEAERKQLLEREQVAREAAERANRIKDEFLAVLSHELRSPLNPILGWSRLLQHGNLDETTTTQALATIERNAKLQSELIEDLLDVSRILRGKLSLNIAPVNLASTIRAAMETVRLAAEAKAIRIEASLAGDVGFVSGDSTRLQQVVWNLLSNAVKFTPPRGQVNIRLERLGSSAQITVCDTGQGIEPEFLPYVFDYFRQADGSTTRKFGGLGLGLAIVRQLVELHGGTISVSSPGLEQGATFTVQVPLLSTCSEVNRDETSPQQSLDLSGIRILVVDDETDARELVAFVLEQQGAHVTAVSSAHEALLILPQAKLDILLSDIGMPDMDGYMLIQQVRRLTSEQGGSIPAIALTAYAGEINQQQALAVGFQKHISKPIEPEKLIQEISSLVRAI